GGKSECAALGHVVGRSGGGAVGGAVIDGNTLGTSGGEGHAEVGIDRLAGISFGERDVIDGNCWSVVVGDNRGDLLDARLDGIGYGGDVHNDGFVNFVQRIRHGGQSNRAGVASGRDDDRSCGSGVVSAQRRGA